MQINRSLFRVTFGWMRNSLLSHQRWWEMGMIGLGVLVGATALYWWLWQPLSPSVTQSPVLTTRLDVAALEELTRWVTEREGRGTAGTLEGRFDAMFK